MRSIYSLSQIDEVQSRNGEWGMGRDPLTPPQGGIGEWVIGTAASIASG